MTIDVAILLRIKTSALKMSRVRLTTGAPPRRRTARSIATDSFALPYLRHCLRHQRHRQEAPVEGAWARPATEGLFDAYVDAGIQVVRIPIRWDNHTGNTAPYTINSTWMERTKEVVSWSLKRGLITIINTHHDSWLDDPDAFESKLPRFVAIWTQIAAAYANASHLLAFEVFNEPHQMTVDQLNVMNAAVLPIIRTQHPTRIVFIGGLQFMNPTWILANPNAMHLFPNDSYVAVEVCALNKHGSWLSDARRIDFLSIVLLVLARFHCLIFFLPRAPNL
eukprot:m.967006 g.967006  ORF g.967006 m.967006 type:complete len:279 (-) comp23913_c0_seq9:5288-6124(-)